MSCYHGRLSCNMLELTKCIFLHLLSNLFYIKVQKLHNVFLNAKLFYIGTKPLNGGGSVKTGYDITMNGCQGFAMWLLGCPYILKFLL